MTNKEVAQRFFSVLWGNKDLAVIDELMHPDASIASPFNVAYGPLTMKEVAEKWLTAFPDLVVDCQSVVAEGDEVAVRWQANGTHLGSLFETNPTHQEIYYTGVTFLTVQAGKITAYWALVDMHALLKQAGVNSLEEAIE